MSPEQEADKSNFISKAPPARRPPARHTFL